MQVACSPYRRLTPTHQSEEASGTINHETLEDGKDLAVNGAIGRRHWAIAEGYIPEWSHGPEPQMLSHETACLLNASDQEAHVEITVYFKDREPVGPYRITVPARRTHHVRFNDLDDPAPVPAGPTTPQ